MHRVRSALVVPTLATLLAAQHGDAGDTQRPALYVAPASAAAQQQIKGFQLAAGLSCELVAAEPDLCNAVAFAIDERGRFYVAETFRINDGVFDTRNYMKWKDDDLACTTVAERIAKYEKHIPKDIPKYAAYTERIRLLWDEDKNGVVDHSVVFADGFADLADGIASGVLPHGGDVFFTNIPKLWRLRDTDGDGKADERTALHDGYGVHTSLIGHDMHGLIVGPDRRLYFSIGDRGLHVEHEGRTLSYPHEGAVLRCELDGSRLEVVHRGLRNPQELAFDQFGDLFTGDNNSDGGDRARFVHIVPGGDSGWRIGYQWLDDRGAWNRERLWWPRYPGQPAWITPPLFHLGDGPSGLAYDPGIGLPERYRDCFFLCDFRGGAGYSGIHAVKLMRSGAGFELERRERPIWGVLATDCDFGPDGSLYVLDWVESWSKTGKGRIYRVRGQGTTNDLQLRNTANLLAGDWRSRPTPQLAALLAHADRRVRQQAQFTLVDRNARDELLAAARGPDQRLARLHGIWGLAVLGRKDQSALDGVPALLDDGDAEVRAQAARALGDVGTVGAARALAKAALDPNSRVRKEAAIALGRLGPAVAEPALPALLQLARENDDHDALLRHAAVFGLAGTASAAALADAATDPSPAVRLVVLLAMARQRDPTIARFLADEQLPLRFEAARAIYEEPIDAGMPALAALVHEPPPHPTGLIWRALNANRMLGLPEHGLAVLGYALQPEHPVAMRIEAVRILADWPRPHGQDRVFGNWRPVQHPRSDEVVAAFARALPDLLHSDDEVIVAAAQAAGALRLRDSGAVLAALVADQGRSSDARRAGLEALVAIDAPQLANIAAAIEPGAPSALRQAAVRTFSKRDPQQAVPLLASLLQNGSTGERQAAFQALGDLQHPTAAALLREWLLRLGQGEVAPALQLDLIEACGKHQDATLKEALADVVAVEPDDDPLAPYRICLEGGDARAGRKVFFEHEATRCTRCHAIGGQGGSAGPVLDGIGSRKDREYLLRALVAPSADIAPGFATTVLELHNGDTLAGVLGKDQDGAVEITGIDGEKRTVPWERIAKRSPSPSSAMPAMGGTLSRRQLRDVVAYLASLKQ